MRVSRFTLGTPSASSGEASAIAMAVLSRQVSATVCVPGTSGRVTTRCSRRIGCIRPLIDTDWSSAPSGSVSACCPPRLVRISRVSVVSRARRPGVVSSTAWSTVSVGPGTAAGRTIAIVTPSPGQGCHSRSLGLASAGRWTTGMPSTSTCQIGLASSRQISVHATASGARSTREVVWSRIECQLTSETCGPMLTSALPPCTRTSGVATDSPGIRGTSRTTAEPGGVTRTTRVSAWGESPRDRERSTSTKGGRAAG